MAADARAAHVTQLDTWINRVTGVPMEPRSALGVYDAASGRYTLYAGSGGIVRQKREIAQILGLTKRTVDFHTDNARGKLGAATRTEAAIKAASGKLIEP